jgi:hypothetical protein
MGQAILGIWVSNFWWSARQVGARLLAEGHMVSVKGIFL